MGRHSRQARRTTTPSPRCPGIELVDAVTRVAHRVTSDALLAGRLAGTYQAICGARLVSASMIDPGHRQCRECDR